MAEGGQRYVPSDDVLHMAVLDIHLGGPRNWNAASAVPHGHDEVRVYRSLAPLSSGEEEKEEAGGGGVHAPVVSSIHTGCAPTNFAMPSTSGK